MNVWEIYDEHVTDSYFSAFYPSLYAPRTPRWEIGNVVWNEIKYRDPLTLERRIYKTVKNPFEGKSLKDYM